MISKYSHMKWDVTLFYDPHRKKWLYRLNSDHNTGTFLIPKGFVTDFASVPKIFWGIIPPIGKTNRAAVNHDFRYINTIENRKKADSTFLKEMLEDGVFIPKAFIMYLWVRSLGWYKWNIYKKLNKNT